MRFALSLMTAVVALVACGPDPVLSESLAAELQDRVASVRAAAGRGDVEGAESALAELRDAVADGVRAGDIERGRARQILREVDAVEGSLAAIIDPDEESDETEFVEDEEDEEEIDEEDEEEIDEEDEEDEADHDDHEEDDED